MTSSTPTAAAANAAPRTFAFDAYVTDALIDGSPSAAGQAVFALGDGQVAWADGVRGEAHDGAVLCAAAHPSGDGVVTGGDDGRVVWSRRAGDGVEQAVLAELKGRWIDALATSADSGLVAFAAGRDVHVRDVDDARFERRFTHDKSVAGLAFDPKGRRLAAATYGGVALWYARIAEQKPVMLKWAGSHVAVAFSPDGKFLLSAMQENALHGWRLSDAKDMRMGGYPAKIKSLAFLENGLWLATSGANGVVLWPFQGANGPMGKQANEIGFDESALVARLSAEPGRTLLAAGLDDGRVWVCDLKTQRLETLKADKGPPISALVLKGDAVAWGDEEGGAGVAPVPF
ncbi:WD40 repeat domain-containing protein [Caulobacter sp. KR2-114]|uniref:WD40 repeat domain-containing protein n=1 Tax=Caulobacter sp. KR2-114 TaxID=3400912 RepID=UPI003BFB4469